MKKILPLLLPLLLVVACSKDTDFNKPLKPETPVNSDDWQDVSSSEGEITKDDVRIVFPAGAFSDGDRVAVSTVKKGLVGGDRERSIFYQITLPKSGTKKDVNVYINCDEAASDKVFVARTPSWERHTGKTEFVMAVLDGWYNADKGYLRTVIPPVDPCDDENPFFSLGVMQGFQPSTSKASETEIPAMQTTFPEGSGPIETKADSYKYRYTWAMDSFSMPAFLVYSQKYSEINQFLKTNIPAAHAALKSLGFQLPDCNIYYKVEEFANDETAWGYMSSSKYVTSWGYVRLNAKRLYEFANSAGDATLYSRNAGQIQQTLVHETSHAVHEFVYDPRTAAVRNATGLLGDEWAMLSEAVGCWTEKSTGDKRISENTPYFCHSFLEEFFPHERSWAKYQDHGYGMGFFIKLIADNLGNNAVIGLYQKQHDGTASSVVDAFEKTVKGTALKNIFTTAEYNEFLRDIITGTMDNRADMIKLFNSQKFEGLRKKDYTGKVYKFGMTANKIILQKEVIDRNEGMAVSVLQQNSELISYIYIRKDSGNYELVGVSKDATPALFPITSLSDTGGSFYVVSLRNPDNAADAKYTLLKNGSVTSTVTVDLSEFSELKPFKNFSVLCEFTTSDGGPGRVSLVADNGSNGKFTSSLLAGDYDVKLTSTTYGNAQCTFKLVSSSPGNYTVKDLRYTRTWDDLTESLSIDVMPQAGLNKMSGWWEAGTASTISYTKRTKDGSTSYSKQAKTPVGDNCFRVQVVF